jgi:hypothetical protein
MSTSYLSLINKLFLDIIQSVVFILGVLIKDRQFLLCCNLVQNMGRFTALYEGYKIGEKI